jgi:hypothetical protein
MQLKGSLPWSQEPSAGPYPHPYKSTPYYPFLPKIHLISTHLLLGLLSGSFIQDFPINVVWETARVPGHSEGNAYYQNKETLRGTTIISLRASALYLDVDTIMSWLKFPKTTDRLKISSHLDRNYAYL